jgi:hypothetical protein
LPSTRAPRRERHRLRADGRAAEARRSDRARLRELEGGDDDNFDDDAFQDEYRQLDTERDEIHALAQTNASAEFKAATGVLVFLASDGVQIKRGRLKPGQTVDKAGAIRGTPKAAKTDTGGDAKPKKPELSAAILSPLAHTVAKWRAATSPAIRTSRSPCSSTTWCPRSRWIGATRTCCTSAA